jgi:hypothetical protein
MLKVLSVACQFFSGGVAGLVQNFEIVGIPYDKIVKEDKIVKQFDKNPRAF